MAKEIKLESPKEKSEFHQESIKFKWTEKVPTKQKIHHESSGERFTSGGDGKPN